MEKEQYLNVRKRLLEGQVSAEEMRLFYDYYLIFRDETKDEIPFQKFSDSFSEYLGYGVNYHNTTNKVIDYFDDLLEVQTVLNDKNQILAIR